MKRFLTILTVLLLTVALCCSAAFAAPAGEIDLDALAAALGLSEAQTLELTEGTLDVNDVDLSQVDLGAVVEAVGMTQEEVIDSFGGMLDLGIDLSSVELSEVDVEGLVNALSLSDEEITGMLQGNVEQLEIGVFDVNVGAVIKAVGLDAEQTKEAIGQQMGLPEEVLEIVDLEQMDLSSVDDALGLTEEQMGELMTGELDFNEVDLSDVDLGALVEAVGTTEEQVKELVKETLDMPDMDLSGVEFSEIDVGALVDAAGLTGDDLNALVKGELDPTQLDLAAVDPAAAMDALGLSAGDVAKIGLPFLLDYLGLDGLDWQGLLSSAGRGAMMGCIAGGAAVIIIIVLLAVCGSKKRTRRAAAEE